MKRKGKRAGEGKGKGLKGIGKRGGKEREIGYGIDREEG